MCSAGRFDRLWADMGTGIQDVTAQQQFGSLRDGITRWENSLVSQALIVI